MFKVSTFICSVEFFAAPVLYNIGSCSIWRSGKQNTFHTFVTALEFSSLPSSQYSWICNNFRGAHWAKPSTLSPVTVRKEVYMT